MWDRHQRKEVSLENQPKRCAYAFRQGSKTEGGELDRYGLEETLAFGFPRAMWLLAVNRFKYGGKWELHLKDRTRDLHKVVYVPRADLERTYDELAEEFFAGYKKPQLDIRGVI